jgi:predicted Zn-dependent protease
MSKQQKLSRRLALTGLVTTGFGLSSSAQAFNLCVGPLCTDDVKNVGKMLSSVTLNETDEIRMGEEYYGPIIDAFGGAYANSAAQADARRFASPLFQTSSRTNFAWDIVVIDNNEINAWALPGGKVGINKGLLRYVDNEHELAAVVAHEVGHVELSHALKEMKKSSFADGLTGVTQKALLMELENGAAAAAGLGALAGPLMRLVSAGYSRDSEFEADAHIATVFDSTGHDLARGTGIYQTLLETVPKKSKGTTSLFAGHPETQKRLDALMEISEERPAGLDTEVGGQSFAGLKTPFPTRHHYLRNLG